MPRFLPVLVALAIFPLAAADEQDADAAKPATAILLFSDDEAIISWLPGLEAADAYNVYGVHATGRTLLETVVSLTHATVSAGFQSYEVTAIQGSVESTPTTAMGPPDCITIHQGPPPSVTTGCNVRIELQPELIQTPLALA